MKMSTKIIQLICHIKVRHHPETEAQLVNCIFKESINPYQDQKCDKDSYVAIS